MKERFKKFMTWLFGPICPTCKYRCHTVSKKRMNTRYENEESNFITECDGCFEITQDHWDDMWADYYGGRL